MISRMTLSTMTFDVLGSVSFMADRTSGNIESLARRGNVTATLDGGAYVEDMGFSDADREWDIKVVAPTVLQVMLLKYLVKTYSILIVASSEGVFTCWPSNISLDSTVKLRINLLSRLSA